MTVQLESQRNRKPFTPEEFESVYSKVPRLTVGLVIPTQEGIVLTLRSHYAWKDQWHIPGGTVLYKETLAEAIDRVGRDEIGASVKMGKLLGYIEYPSEEKQRGFGSSVSLVFLCTTEETAFSVNEDASRVEAFWTLPEDIIAEEGEFLKSRWDAILKKP